MGTLVIGTIDMATLVIGGLIGKFLIPTPKPTAAAAGSECCSAEDAPKVKASLLKLKAVVDKALAALD